MNADLPIWRQAINDEAHPLHRAAWMLFGSDFDAAHMAGKLAGQQADVVGFCLLLLDSPELYPSSALGGGSAPVNAVKLLCEWRVEAALPRLLQIMETESWDTIVYGTTADLIAAYGSALVEPLLDMASRRTGDQEQVAIAGTLADAAPGDPRTVAFVRKVFDTCKQDFEIGYMSESVLTGDPEGGAKWLESKLRTHKYSQKVRKTLERNIASAKAGRF